MSETCIVCLGDLESANALPHPLVPAIKPENDDHRGLTPSTSRPSPTPNDHGSEMIAHLLPCGHDLHNECLKPWVERANSCPICRQSFNQVDLLARVGGKLISGLHTIFPILANTKVGPVVSSYAVSDRTQIADVDPSMLIEEYDDEELEDQPCPLCGDDDNEELLLQCDGCDTYYHTYCVDLDDVPIGHWFCETCATQRAIESVCPPSSTQPAARSHNPVDRRTRGQQRQVRNRNQVTSSNWARVWQSVWDNLNLDLDFPFDEGSDTARIDRTQRASSQRRDFRAWERRFQIAERQGGANRFRDTASALLDIHAVREHPRISEPESREEILAWNALEKAKEIELDPTPKRKRKSATTSPSENEPVTQPQRPLKRPRTRRAIDQPEASSSAFAELSGSRRGSGAGPSSSRNLNAHNLATQSNGPSFLQSMLKEIETSSAPDETKGQSRWSMQSATNHSSPQTSSPGASPTTSNHATPRARSTTPPPSLSTRPGSPLSLTSKVEPIYPPPEFSPERSPPNTTLTYRPSSRSRQALKDRRQSRPVTQGSSPPPRSSDTSPSRNMPLSTKSELQKMVTAALKPHYPTVVSKDQYTDINRNVSRMLYEKVGENGSLEGEARESWERLAREEVAKAVQSLKAST